MPSKRTTNYQLSQWEPDDKVLMDDFNEDNAKIDAALKSLNTSLTGKASSSSLSGLQSTVNTKASQTDLDTLSAKVTQLQSTLSALQTTVSNKQDASAAVKFKAGKYTGNNNASQTITVGFTPKAVALYACDGAQYLTSVGKLLYGGLAITGAPLQIVDGSKTYPAMEIVTNGFKVYYNYDVPNNSAHYCNRSDTTYYYIAFA